MTFSYPARTGVVLEGVTLELRPGETVALVGPSGAGKSTVAKLLLRLVEPTTGVVSVDGTDLASCDTEAWRRLVAWVPQRPTIFRGTVTDNILLGNPSADDEAVWAAAQAGGRGLVRPGPAPGIRDDGGRRRPSVVRRRAAEAGVGAGIPAQRSLVVLDEPTANLDPASAELVADAVEQLRKGRTLLVIAHRPEPVRRADRVVTLEAGRIVTERKAAAA